MLEGSANELPVAKFASAVAFGAQHAATVAGMIKGLANQVMPLKMALLSSQEDNQELQQWLVKWGLVHYMCVFWLENHLVHRFLLCDKHCVLMTRLVRLLHRPQHENDKNLQINQGFVSRKFLLNVLFAKDGNGYCKWYVRKCCTSYSICNIFHTWVILIPIRAIPNAPLWPLAYKSLTFLTKCQH